MDRPGGHPEPHLVNYDENAPGVIRDDEEGQEEDYSDLDPQKVLQEIFISHQNELRDEVFLACVH